MYGYDGQTFETFEEFLEYLYTKYGDLGAANHASITWWGEDLHGNYLYIDGIQQLGTEGEALANAGFSEAEQVMRAYTQNPAQVSANTIAQLNRLKQTQEATIQGTTFTNGAIQLGTSEAQGGQVLTATKPIVSDNGSVYNAPKVMTEEAVEDPTVPGTFSYLATLKALGWLPLPTWTAAVAPLLGVGLGVGLYDLNPEFWEKVSRTLLPFCYDDNGTPKMPVSVDENGNVHTPETAIEALRQLFIEEGAYNTGNIEYEYTVGETITSLHSNASFSAYAQYIYEASTLYENTNNPYNASRYGTGPKQALQSSLEYFINNISALGTLADDEVYILYTGGGTSYGNKYNYFLTKGKFQPTGTVIVRNMSSYSGAATKNGIAPQLSQSCVYIEANAPCLYANNTCSYGSDTFTNNGRGTTTASSRSIGSSSYEHLGPAGPIYLPANSSVFIIMGEVITSPTQEGVTPESGATYPTDTTKNLAEIYPTWASNAINVVNNPTGTTIEDSTEKWYPVSLSNTNYSTDTANTSSTQTQTDAQSGANTDSAQLNQIAQALQELTQTLTESGVLPANPTIPSDPSGNTPTPTPPVITGAGSDLIAIYNPTKAQLQAFNQFLWSLDPTNLTNWKKVFANPIDAVIALQMIYVTPITGENRYIKCGYIETDVSSKIVTNQYVDIDCGLVHLGEYFHNIWDYVATRVELYLPFIGIVPLHVGDVMESDIRVRYRVDVYTGTCLAQVIVLKGNSLATLYTYTGNCAVQLPVTSGQFAALWGALIAAGATAVTAGLGGAGLGAALGAGAKMGGKSLLHSGGASMQRSGGLGANAGAMGIRTPYLIINRNVPLDAHMYQTQYGFPANKTVVLGNMNGYTRVKDIHLAGIPCTDDELEQIESLLKEGVIIN